MVATVLYSEGGSESQPTSARSNRRCRPRPPARDPDCRANLRRDRARRLPVRGYARRTSAAGVANPTTASSLRLLRTAQLEPVEPMARQCQQIGQVADARELDMPGELDRRVTAPMLQVQLEGLGETRQIVHAEHDVAVIRRLAQERQHRRVGAAKLLEAADGEGLVPA